MKNLLVLVIFWLILAGGSRAQAPGRLDPLQGGENAATAFVLSGPLPLMSSGTTEGYLDDYDEACPYTGSAAPDVVYAYTAPSGMTVDIDLCGSSYDTKLFVYENSVTPGNPFACNDDFYFDETCGIYVSKIEGAVLAAGNTYYIVIDGYSDFDYGNYILTLSETGPLQCIWGVDIVCPPWAIAENEACGANTNGGCDMTPGTQNWETVPSAGATICGTTWASGGSKDSDWYKLVLTQASSFSMTANADQEIIYGLVETTTPGSPSCATLTGAVNPSNTAGPCSETFLDLGTLSPGTYWFKVQMTASSGFPCTNHYRIDFEVNPLTCSAPEALLASNITTGSADLSWVETGTATAWEYQVGPPFFVPAETGVLTNSNPVTVADLSSNTTYDFYVRSACSPGYSTWTGPVTFTTDCDGTATFPWAEGFESAWPPSCWTDSEAADFGWDQSTFGSEHSGSEWAYCNKAGSILTSPGFLPPSAAWLIFWYRVENAAFPQDLTVKIGNTTIFQVSADTNTAYKEVHVSLDGYIGQVISISFTGGTGAGGADYGICLDDVSTRQGFIWTGNVSTSWNTPGNWNIPDIPDLGDIVTIPSAPSGGRFPEVNNGVTGECYSISILPGASVILKTGGLLNVKNP